MQGMITLGNMERRGIARLIAEHGRDDHGDRAGAVYRNLYGGGECLSGVNHLVTLG